MNNLLKTTILLLSGISIYLCYQSVGTFQGEFAIEYWLILTSLIIAEVGYISYGHSNKATLTAPFLNVAILIQPLFLVYSTIFIYNLAFRIVVRVREKVQEPILNEKLLFNISVQIILTYVTKLMLDQFEIEPNFMTLGILWGINFLIVTANGLLVAAVVYLAGNKRSFADYRPFNYMYLINYYTLITWILFFLYRGYHVEGLSIGFVFILFSQTTILLKSSTKVINERLIFDKLTRAYNRNYMEEIIEGNISRRKPFTLTFIDLDDFKRVNDAYGHVVGDGLLVDFVAIINNMLTKKERLFRYGGDEFCVISYETDSLQNFKKNMSDYVFMYKAESTQQLIHYQISSGEYYYTGKESLSFSDVINYVDQHMYRNKKSKKSSDEAIL